MGTNRGGGGRGNVVRKWLAAKFGPTVQLPYQNEYYSFTLQMRTYLVRGGISAYRGDKKARFRENWRSGSDRWWGAPDM